MSRSVLAHRAEIDGLRAVAVLPVIAHHAGFPGISGGFLGVDIFFVISGYLITRILMSDLSDGRFSIMRFYERRARRIMPALTLTLLFCLPMAVWLMLPGQLAAFGRSAISVVFFVSNIHFWRSTNYFSESADLQPLLHTWSLAVEEQFYLFFPLLLLGLQRCSRRQLAIVFGAMAGVSFALAVWAAQAAPSANFYLLPTRAWELLAGALCTLAGSRERGRFDAVLAGLGLAMVAVSMVAIDTGSALPGFGSLLPVAGTCLVILFAHSGCATGALLAARPLVAVGLVSYSAYLFHQPLFAFARLGWPDAAGPGLLGLLGVVSLGLAGLSWRWIEQPFRRSGTLPLPTRAGVFGAGVAASALIGILGAVLVATHGLAFRFAPHDRPLALFDREAAGDYVRTQFNQTLLRPFAEDGKPRLLVVGDSFGQDFVNILHESGIAPRLAIATHHISRHCGNLLVKADLSDHILPNRRSVCDSEGGFERKELQPLIEAADIIVLASDWQPWQLPHVAETVRRLSARGKAKVFVLGRKNFGVIRFRSLLDLEPNKRGSATNPIGAEQLTADTTLRKALGERFIDMEAALCVDGTRCPLFTPAGEVISYDGGHLTQAGAHWAGTRLSNRLNEVLFPPRVSSRSHAAD